MFVHNLYNTQRTTAVYRPVKAARRPLYIIYKHPMLLQELLVKCVGGNVINMSAVIQLE